MHALKLDSVDPKRTFTFNTNEQLIGDTSVQLASVLRVLVRKLPLILRDWRLVPHQAKENIWKIVMNRFIMPEYYKDYYFSKMGTYLREARSRKAGLVLDALDRLQGEEKEKRLDKLMPKTMTVREWEDFVKHVNSVEFRVDLQKDQGTTKEIDRADLWKIGHKQCKGKKPNPGVVEAFEKLEKAQAEHGADCGSSMTDDILAKAFGEDKKTKGKELSHYKMMIRECQKSCRAMNDRLVKLEGRSSKCVCNGVSPSHRSSPKASNNQEASTSRIVQVPEIFQACKMLSWYKEGEVVPEAEIGETNLQMLIHGLLIGFGDAHVYRPNSEIKYVGEAVSNFITWPKDRISYE
ncbi:hypothetical protein MKW98_011908 [Papaver atlanticum]|uniref:Uncharacterized protein n=1 Tax=Papaver atlanticum TaxID=357466 RepID=A0AAD4T689_9MAGN|nr:hypothetical protein MKW98_011908 [Papaver atlanticum]